MDCLLLCSICLLRSWMWRSLWERQGVTLEVECCFLAYLRGCASLMRGGLLTGNIEMATFLSLTLICLEIIYLLV